MRHIFDTRVPSHTVWPSATKFGKILLFSSRHARNLLAAGPRGQDFAGRLLSKPKYYDRTTRFCVRYPNSGQECNFYRVHHPSQPQGTGTPLVDKWSPHMTHTRTASKFGKVALRGWDISAAQLPNPITDGIAQPLSEKCALLGAFLVCYLASVIFWFRKLLWWLWRRRRQWSMQLFFPANRRKWRTDNTASYRLYLDCGLPRDNLFDIKAARHAPVQSQHLVWPGAAELQLTTYVMSITVASRTGVTTSLVAMSAWRLPRRTPVERPRRRRRPHSGHTAPHSVDHSSSDTALAPPQLRLGRRHRTCLALLSLTYRRYSVRLSQSPTAAERRCYDDCSESSWITQ